MWKQSNGSKETREGREIKEEELKKKGAQQKTQQEETRRDRLDGERNGAKQGGNRGERNSLLGLLKGNDYKKALRKSLLRCRGKIFQLSAANPPPPSDLPGWETVVSGIRLSEMLCQDHSVRHQWRQSQPPPAQSLCSSQTSLFKALSVLNSARVGADDRLSGGYKMGPGLQKATG
ncbi:hypothetical protein CRENBAI_023692 [Crenichthys baileyi]|uniref:Uncharacterized protein n=1 Tax=Crenichthys baileyi TaxID=28760 RepID=A0AAV9RHU4_9TELE